MKKHVSTAIASKPLADSRNFLRVVTKPLLTVTHRLSTKLQVEVAKFCGIWGTTTPQATRWPGGGGGGGRQAPQITVAAPPGQQHKSHEARPVPEDKLDHIGYLPEQAISKYPEAAPKTDIFKVSSSAGGRPEPDLADRDTSDDDEDGVH